MKHSLLLAAVLVLSFSASVWAEGARQYEGDALRLFVWKEYTDPEVPKLFEEEFGAKVVESNFASNEELLAKLQAGDSGYDLVVPSDYMVSALIRGKLLLELDLRNVPNLRNTAKRFRNPGYDPGNKHSVPYQWGLTGIGYNRKHVKTPPDSWADLFDPERLKKCKNRVSMLDDMREVIGAALIYLGHSPNTTNALHLQAAEKVLREQKKYLAKYDSESFKDSLASGEILLAQGWSGELAAAQADNPDLGFAVPKEGALMFVDNWCIPKGAPNKRLAEEFINFMLRPKISARNVQAVMYASTNEAAEKLIDPKILDGPAYCMPKDLKVWTLETPGDALDYYEHVWTNLRAE